MSANEAVISLKKEGSVDGVKTSIVHSVYNLFILSVSDD